MGWPQHGRREWLGGSESESESEVIEEETWPKGLSGFQLTLGS